MSFLSLRSKDPFIRPTAPDAPISQEFVPTVNQPDQARYAQLQGLRYSTSPAAQLDSAFVTPSDTSFVATGTSSVRFSDYRYYSTSAVPQFDGPTNQQTYEFTVGQPEQEHYSFVQQAWRSLQPAIKQHEGPTSQQTFPVPPVTTNPSGWNERIVRAYTSNHHRVSGPQEQFDGPTVQQTYEFKLGQPEASRYALLNELRFVVLATPYLANPDFVAPTNTDVFNLSQPDKRYDSLRDRLRYIVGEQPQLDGPTTQQTYEFVPNQPEFIRFSGLANALRSMTRPPLRDEGPTTQQTYEFFPGQPDQIRYGLPRNWQRFITAPPLRAEGATTQQTFPVPGVTTRPDNWFGSNSSAFRDVLLRLAGPKPQFDGATIQQRFEFPVNQPDQARYDSLRQWLRFVTAPPLRAEGATNQDTLPIPGVTVRPDAWFAPYAFSDILRRLTGPQKQFDGATSQQKFEFPVNQPELIRFDQLRQALRFITAPPLRDEGATNQDWFIYPTNQADQARYAQLNRLRFITAPPSRTESEVAVIFQTYEFFPNQPELRGYARKDANRYIVGEAPQFDGATNQQTYEFVPNQPEQLGYDRIRQRGRYIVEAVKRFDGATTQQTYTFFPNQPELRKWNLPNPNRYELIGPTPQFTGATTQQLFQFFPGQPELRRYNLLDPNRVERIGSRKQFEGATSQASYEFTPNQPEQRRWNLPNPNRFEAIGPTAQLTGATTQQRFEFSPNQPDRWNRYPKYPQPIRLYINDIARVVLDSPNLPPLQSNPRPDWFTRDRNRYNWKPLWTLEQAPPFFPCRTVELLADDGTTKQLIVAGGVERLFIAFNGTVKELVAYDEELGALLAHDGTVFTLKGVC